MISSKTDHNYLLFIGWGIVLWLIFLVMVRLIGDSVFSTGNPLLFVTYVISIPILCLLIIGIGKLTQTPANKMLVPVVIMDSTALLIDGLTVGFTNFYGPTHDQIAAAGASLLWGVGVTLVFALWLSNRHS